MNLKKAISLLLVMCLLRCLAACSASGNRKRKALRPQMAVADYFRDDPADGISWTLDYNGVTFYFADGDLADPGTD